MVFFGAGEAYRRAGLGHKEEYLIYTLILSVISFVGLTLIGWISQIIKNRSNWQNWSFTKKGFIIGLITSILVFISLIIYTGYWMYTANKGFTDLVNDEGFWIISVSIITPIIICTIAGYIIGKIKSKKSGIA